MGHCADKICLLRQGLQHEFEYLHISSDKRVTDQHIKYVLVGAIHLATQALFILLILFSGGRTYL